MAGCAGGQGTGGKIGESAAAASSANTDAGGDLESGFSNPPAGARPQTYWLWMNGNITREGITADLEAMARVGVGGALTFNVAGSHGCDIPPGPVDYLSPAWLDMVRHAAGEVDRLGLKLCMQNCAGWSTTGGPWIKPEDAMQALAYTEIKVDGGGRIERKLPQPEIRQDYYRDIAIFAFHTPKNDSFRVHQWQPKAAQRGGRSGRQPDLRPCPPEAAIALDAIVDVSQHLRKDGTLVWDAPPGRWTILRLGHTPTGTTNHPSPDSGRGLEVDKLSRAGLDVHWRKGIQPVLDHLGGLAGKAFNNILVDSYEAGLNQWTPRLREEFLKRRGYDPTPYLMTLTGRLVGDGPTTDRFLWDFRRTVADLFADNYYGYFADLCHDHGLLFSIEPYTSCFEGLAVAAKVDIVMGEFWDNGGYSHTLRLAASAAHTHGRTLAGAESFTSSPPDGRWQNHPGSLKRLGDLAWTKGINRFIFHRYAHQPWTDKVPGMTMGQYGSHFERTNTWWEPGRAWMRYIARSQFLLQSGDFAAEVLCFAGDAAPNGGAFIKGLKDAGYDYDGCGTDIMAVLKVEDGDVVLPSGKHYRLLVMPNTPFQTPALARKVRELVRGGATVLGPKPKYTPSLAGLPASEEEVRAIGQEVWGKCDGTAATSNRFGKGQVFTGVSPADVLARLDVAPAVQLASDAPALAWIRRCTPDADIFFVSNQSGTRAHTIVGFGAAGRRPEFWNAEQGAIRPAPGWTVAGEHVRVPLDLAPDESVFVVFRQPGKPEADPYVRVEGPTRKDPGPLVIRRANYGAADGDSQKQADVTAALAALVRHGRILTTANNDLARRDPAPSVAKQLRIEYEWAGRTFTTTVRANDLVALPPAHLLPESWRAGFEAGEGTRLRAWDNGLHSLHHASGKTRRIEVSGLPEPLTLGGPWTLRFQPGRGAPAEARLDRLISWSDHTNPGIRYFSGTATTTTRFELPKGFLQECQEVWLDLGEVAVMAEVRLNQKGLGILWHGPFRIEVSKALRPGFNTLEVDVTNLWVNRLIGDEHCPGDCEWTESHLTRWPDWLTNGKPRPVPSRITFTTWKHWAADDPLLPSGLLGPVSLRCARLVPMQ